MKYSASDQRFGWRIVPAHRFANWADQWQNLNSKGARTPALDKRLIKTLIEEFAGPHTHLAILGNPAAPSAMLLLQRESQIAWRIFTADFAPIAPTVALPEVDLATEWPNLLARLPGMPQMLIATDLDPDTAPRPPNAMLVDVKDDFVTHRVTIDRSFDQYFAERPAKFRSNLRRCRNLVTRKGLRPRIECVTSPEEMRQLVHDHARLELSGWKGAEGTAIDPAAPSGRFFLRVMTEMVRTGDAIGWRYLYDEDVVATDLGIRGFGTVLGLKSAYDERYSDTSPGHLMRLEMMHALFDTGEVERFEFMGGGAWQHHWSHETRTVYQLHVHRSLAAVNARRLWKGAKSGLRRVKELSGAAQPTPGRVSSPA